jgi:hypothetical protein
MSAPRWLRKQVGAIGKFLGKIGDDAQLGMPKQVGELCHAEALFLRQASEQSLTCLRVCRHVSLDGKRCVRLDWRSVGEYITALAEARNLSW